MKYILIIFILIYFSFNCQSQVIREVLSPAQQHEADSLNAVIKVKLQGRWMGGDKDSLYMLRFYGDSIELEGNDKPMDLFDSNGHYVFSINTAAVSKLLIKSTFQLTGNGLIKYMVKGYNPDDTSVPGYYARSWGSAYFLNDTLRVSGSYLKKDGVTTFVNYKKLP